MDLETSRLRARRIALIAGFVPVVFAALLQPAPAGEVKFPAEPPPSNDIRIENRVAVPMRDGVILYADVFRPVEEGKHPVLVQRTPYSSERYPTSYREGVYFARRGYVFVMQDVRGRHESEGKWEPFRDDIEDGYDTVEWAAKQSWSNGKVGMQGSSYKGHVQWRAAMADPPSLVTIGPLVASTSLYHDWITLNGGWRLSFNFGWGPCGRNPASCRTSGLTRWRTARRGSATTKSLWHFPLNTMQQLVGRNAQFYKDWIAHPDYDDYWKKINAEEVFREDRRSGSYGGRLVRHLQPGNPTGLRRNESPGQDSGGP